MNFYCGTINLCKANPLAHDLQEIQMIKEIYDFFDRVSEDFDYAVDEDFGLF